MPDGKRKAAKAKLGDSLLDVVLENNLDIDGYGEFFLFWPILWKLRIYLLISHTWLVIRTTGNDLVPM